MTGSGLRIARPTEALEPPPDRGRLMNAEKVAEQLFGGQVKAEWVRRHVPGKMTTGHRTVFWWEFEVISWIDSNKDDAT